MSETQSLESLRLRIDDLDKQIQALINDRASCAQIVAQVKAEQEAQQGDYYRPEREAQILRKVLETNEGPVSDEEMARLFRQIISVCLAMESPLKIAYLGPEGTFTQAAVLKHFGYAVNTSSFASIAEIFREVEAGSSSYGVVPVENSTEGVVSHTLDMFLKSPLQICGEVALRVNHHLLGQAQNLSAIEEVISHRQSLAQCREWLSENLPKVKQTTVGSNAEAARLVSKNPKAAAIAAGVAAQLYDLKVLASNIEDEPNNTTRFLVIGKKHPKPSGMDKTSILVSANNRPGALHDLLTPLANNGCEMTRIESRPARSGLWQYVFFLDIEGHVEDLGVARALRALEKESSLFKVLGSYPKAVL